MSARRYNKGKLRYELLAQRALEKIVEVYTKGAHKYTVFEDENGDEIKGTEVSFEEAARRQLIVVDDGADNWRKGLSWTKAIGSVKRHIAEWEKGVDIDPDPSMRTYHLANGAWGLMTLLEFYDTYPQGDDRNLGDFKLPKIGLDLDGVLADYSGGFLKWFDLDPSPSPHYYDARFTDQARKDEAWNSRDFWLSLPALMDGKDLRFEPECYITARMSNVDWHYEWLEKNGFPRVPIIQAERKVAPAKEYGLEIFVEDNIHNFAELNANGIFTYLMTTAYNLKYDVGHRRIESLNDIRLPFQLQTL